MFRKLAKSCVAPTGVGRRRMSMKVFNEDVKTIQRDGAAKRADYAEYEYLREEVARRIMDRLSFISKDFSTVLDIGCGNGAFANLTASRHAASTSPGYKKPSLSLDAALKLDPSNTNFDHLSPEERAAAEAELAEAMSQMDGYHLPQLKEYILRDESTAMLQNAVTSASEKVSSVKFRTDKGDVEEGSVDLAVSNLYLHWRNDLPQLFSSVLTKLKPNGVFIGAMIGGETLRELRSSLTLAELELYGGVSNHVSPFTLPKDIGDLLTNAGFQLVSVDIDRLTVHYPDMFTLTDHLGRMGEQHAPFNAEYQPRRDTMLAASSIYETLYTDPENGMLAATVDVVMFIGWKHDPETMTPSAKRGSATHKIGDCKV